MIRDSVIYIDMEKVMEPKQGDSDIQNNEDSEQQSSFVYIRALHSDDNNFMKYLTETNIFQEDKILKKGYNSIFEKKEKNYMLSVNYLNYEEKYTRHLEKIMIGDILYFSVISDPLQRAIRHYNFSNSFRKIYTFDEYYVHYGDKEGVGWTGQNIITNNYYSKYLGFHSIDEITEENIKKRYALVIVLGNTDDSAAFVKLQKLLGSEVYTNIVLKNDYQVLSKTEEMFKENNKMDYMLYEKCLKILSSG